MNVDVEIVEAGDVRGAVGDNKIDWIGRRGGRGWRVCGWGKSVRVEGGEDALGGGRVCYIADKSGDAWERGDRLEVYRHYSDVLARLQDLCLRGFGKGV